MISQEEYQQRRAKVVSKIGQGAVVIIPSATTQMRNADTQYAFRQNSDFYYLTGFDEPDAILVLLPQGKQVEYLLFCRKRDPEKETWNGKMAGLEGAKANYKADYAYDINEFQSKLPELLENRPAVYFPVARDLEFDKIIFAAANQLRAKARRGIDTVEQFNNIEPIISELRLRKSASEIAVMQKAADISVQAHQRAMQACTVGMYEYELEAELLYTFYKQGCRYPAYPSIVGAGGNSCILHYHQNDAQIKNGDLILIDAGGEYQNYSSDITRTFPANGTYTPEQKAIYNIVLQAQLEALKLIKPGTVWCQLQEKVQEVLKAGLIDLGLLRKDSDNLKQFYMHTSGHWLGLDTHDVGAYKIDGAWCQLEPDFVLTIEPGIYIPANSPGVPEKWWNIGVRIEDDIVVTKDGNCNLTRGLIKQADEIEAFMAG